MILYEKTYSSKKRGIGYSILGILLTALMAAPLFVITVPAISDILFIEKLSYKKLETIIVILAWICGAYIIGIKTLTSGILEFRSKKDWKIFINKERIDFQSANVECGESFCVNPHDVTSVIKRIRSRGESDRKALFLMLKNGEEIKITDLSPFDLDEIASQIVKSFPDIKYLEEEIN